MRTVLQVPLPRPLRMSALNVARDMGFSSLQEVVRVFLHKLANRQITISFQESIPLSQASEKRYARIENDFKLNKNVYTAKDVNDLISQLNED